MKVSVIIPVYNGEAFLAEAVGSVQAQTVSDWEMIVVDDGSTDGSAAVAERLARRDVRIRLVRQTNAGVSAARNAGFAVATGEQVAFLDVDDLWEREALETLGHALDAAPGAPAAHGLGRHVDRVGRPIRLGELERYTRTRHAVRERQLVRVSTDEPTTFEVEVLRNHVCTVGTVLFRRSALARAGLFDPLIAVLEDWDLLLRVCLQGPIVFVDRRVLGKRSHDANVSNDFAALMTGLRHVRRKLLALLEEHPQRHLVAVLGRGYTHQLNLRQELAWARESLCARRPGRVLAHLGRAALFSARAVTAHCRTLGHPGRRCRSAAPP